MARTRRKQVFARKFVVTVCTVIGLVWSYSYYFDVNGEAFGIAFPYILVSLVVALILGFALVFLDAKAEVRCQSFEREMTSALGLSSEPQSHSEAEIEESQPPERVDTPSTSKEGEPARLPQQSDRPRNAQHVPINISSDAAATEIADLVRQQSDGHARLAIKYYTQGYMQASASFFLSITCAVVGFVLIAIFLIQLLQHPDQPLIVGVTGFVSVVNQAVSVLFFRRTDKGRDLMIQLIDKIRTDRENEMKFVAGLTTVEQIKKEGLQDALRAATALTFTGSSINLEQLRSLVNSGAVGVDKTPHIDVVGSQGAVPPDRGVGADNPIRTP